MQLQVSCDESNLEYASRILDFIRQKHIIHTRSDPISSLPPRIAIKILRLLDPSMVHLKFFETFIMRELKCCSFSFINFFSLISESLCNCMLVCRAWRNLCNESCLWKGLCNSASFYRICSCEADQQHLLKHRNRDGTFSWKKIFSERYRLWKNWLTGRCVIRTLLGHTQGILYS